MNFRTLTSICNSILWIALKFASFFCLQLCIIVLLEYRKPDYSFSKTTYGSIIQVRRSFWFNEAISVTCIERCIFIKTEYKKKWIKNDVQFAERRPSFVAIWNIKTFVSMLLKLIRLQNKKIVVIKKWTTFVKDYMKHSSLTFFVYPVNNKFVTIGNIRSLFLELPFEQKKCNPSMVFGTEIFISIDESA